MRIEVDGEALLTHSVRQKCSLFKAINVLLKKNDSFYYSLLLRSSWKTCKVVQVNGFLGKCYVQKYGKSDNDNIDNVA